MFDPSIGYNRVIMTRLKGNLETDLNTSHRLLSRSQFVSSDMNDFVCTFMCLHVEFIK